MSELHAQSQVIPSTGRLLKATALAVAVATVILVTAVLPAEYGIDPTGIGTQLGLNVLGTPAEAAVPDVPVIEPAAAATVAKHDANYRTDSMSLTLAPGKGAEIKAHMNQGDTFVFHWTADAAVAVDMHGERVDAAKDEYTSYWIEREQSEASGTFTAPFDGSHGWYWLNRGDTPVTVQVDISGFQQDLYRP